MMPEPRQHARSARSMPPRPQRLHRMVRPAAPARSFFPDEADDAAEGGASPSSRCGGRSAIRSRPIPLAIVDARTSRPERSDHRRTALIPTRVGQTCSDRLQSQAQAGTGFRCRQRVEAMVFKVYDSLTDGRARWSAHTAFDDPPRRRMRGRARTSKCGRWRSSDRHAPLHHAPRRRSDEGVTIRRQRRSRATVHIRPRRASVRGHRSAIVVALAHRA